MVSVLWFPVAAPDTTNARTESPSRPVVRATMMPPSKNALTITPDALKWFRQPSLAVPLILPAPIVKQL